MVNIEAIVWWAFLLDSVGANITAWIFPNWLKKNYRGFWKHLPLTKGWTFIYLFLVLWVGYTLYRLGVLPY